jgi:hypothetical protein
VVCVDEMKVRTKSKGRCWGRTGERVPARTRLCRIWTELSERLRLRRGRGDTSEDDEGLPHSPCNSPTTTDALLDKTAIKVSPALAHNGHFEIVINITVQRSQHSC